MEDGALGDSFVGEAEHDHEYEQRNKRYERRPVGINARIGSHVAAVCAHNHAGTCQHEPHRSWQEGQKQLFRNFRAGNSPLLLGSVCFFALIHDTPFYPLCIMRGSLLRIMGTQTRQL